MSETNLDFSVRNVPDSWNEAAKDAPEPGEGRVDNRRAGRRLPTGSRPDLTTGTLSGIAMAVITGAAWYLNDINGVFTSGLADFVAASLMAALIAIAVRIGAGPAGPEMRVGIGAALYIVAILGVAFAVSREQFVAVNRRTPSFGELETLVSSLYLNSFVTVASWIVGLAVMGWSTFALRHRFRR